MKYKKGDKIKIKPIIFEFDRDLGMGQFDAKQFDEEGNLIDVWTLNYEDTELVGEKNGD